eukprot:858270-Amphidinium_carterae.1
MRRGVSLERGTVIVHEWQDPFVQDAKAYKCDVQQRPSWAARDKVQAYKVRRNHHSKCVTKGHYSAPLHM